MYELVIFDWDGTLMDSAAKIVNCLQSSARDVGLPVPDEQSARNIIGLGLHDSMKILFGDISEQQIQQMVEHYRQYFVHTDKTVQALFPGVKQGLAGLDEAGVMLGVATGKARVGLNRVLTTEDMHDLFSVTRCADESRSKPHPQMLLDILEYTAIDADKAIMIGDTTYDMEMAVSAGMAALGVSYGVHETEALIKSGAQQVVDSFDDVMNWLESDNRLSVAYGRA